MRRAISLRRHDVYYAAITLTLYLIDADFITPPMPIRHCDAIIDLRRAITTLMPLIYDAFRRRLMPALSPLMDFTLYALSFRALICRCHYADFFFFTPRLRIFLFCC